jgi:tetratricopeptide (TPR) repeat protein
MTRRVPHRFAIDRWTGRAALALALAFATSAELAAAPDAGEAVEPPSDAMADFRLEEAILAMGRGEFERALDLSLLVVMQDPKDARAHREAGRAAHALGRFQIAIDHLERALPARRGLLRDRADKARDTPPRPDAPRGQVGHEQLDGAAVAGSHPRPSRRAR